MPNTDKDFANNSNLIDEDDFYRHLELWGAPSPEAYAALPAIIF